MRSTVALCNFLFVGCASATVPGPTVAVTPYGGPWTHADVTDVMEGARAWEPIGFTYVIDVNETNDLPICPYDWARRGLVDCRIRIGVRQVPIDDLPAGTAAYADRAEDTITIGDAYHGDYLMHLAAHEFGHILLNTSQHLGPGVDGVMASGGSLTVPTAADWALVCATTGICL